MTLPPGVSPGQWGHQEKRWGTHLPFHVSVHVLCLQAGVPSANHKLCPHTRDGEIDGREDVESHLELLEVGDWGICGINLPYQLWKMP